jgi:hypothetical protein
MEYFSSMDKDTKLQSDAGLDCQICGHFGTRKCATDGATHADCEAFLSWTDLWHREMAAIRRTQHATYLVAGIVALLAILIMLLPNLLG